MLNSPQLKIVNEIALYVEKLFTDEGSGHDWWHIYRVWKSASKIAVVLKADRYIVQLASLLHDIADWKFHGGDLSAGPDEARKILLSKEVDLKVIDKVCEIIEHISFKGAGERNKINTLEGEIVQDADRLDAIGAIGVARAFAFGGSKDRPLYDPNLKPSPHDSFEQYKKNTSPTINHFYEKLLLLKDNMNTEEGKRIAEERHKYLEDFLSQFYKEWDGKDNIK